MAVVKRRWRFYETARGRSPVREFLKDDQDCPPGDREEVIAAMKDVEKNGLANEGAKGRVLLALSAFKKKTPKTPLPEIRLARRRLADWRSRGQ